MNFSHRTNRPLRLVVVGLVLTLTAALASTPAAEATYPGRNGRLAFADNVRKAATAPDIYTVRADGTRPRQLTNDDQFDACAAYSPDGRWIAWCKGTVTPERRLEIWIMRADGRHQRQVTRLGGYATFPDFSPDGHRLVFTLVTANGSTDLWTIGVDGRNPRPLTTTSNLSEDNAAWSPDGRRLVFLRGESLADNGQVWVRDLRSGRERQLTTDSNPKDQLPDWSPDGRHIAYAARIGDADDIYVMRADGSRQRAVITGPADDFAPTWSPDGRQLAFLRLLPTSREVWTAAIDGSDQRPVLQSGGGQYAPAWQPRH
jgi:TolB protein